MSCPLTSELVKRFDKLEFLISKSDNDNKTDNRIENWFFNMQLTAEQIAAILGYTPETIRIKMKKGEIPHFLKGSDFRCSGKDFYNYMKSIEK